MGLQRLDHIGIIVEDLEGAKAFFAELGLEHMRDFSVGGKDIDGITGLEGTEVDAAMMETPDGHVRLELIKFAAPRSVDGSADAPANARGIRHLAFAVDDIEDTIERLRPLGGELIGEVVPMGTFSLCYVRGPEGIIVELAKRVG